ncbi:MAG: imidazolonepropionase [Bacteroidetes bacterium]|nr:imidazolonepropionase [Bacteroidota bacterium]
MPEAILLKNIKKIVQCGNDARLNRISGREMASLPCIDDGWLLIENGFISTFGQMNGFEDKKTGFPSERKEIDCSGRFVFPTWCDSHTHFVFAASRENEFTDRIRGLSYEEIAKRGGGILNSAEKLNAIPEEELLKNTLERIDEIIKTGTGAVEIKSGYGLTLEGELKMLRVIKKLKKLTPVTLKSTFLGAHALPAAYRDNRDEYLKLITGNMLPAIAEKGLADYIDVFCERNYFTPEETDLLLEAGARFGLKPKIHVNQFSILGGVATAVKNKAVSVDHLEVLGEDDLYQLHHSSTIATLLPSCSFFLGIPYASARKLIENDITVALASDFNPGSSPSGNMNFVVSLACIKMKMTPEEAINAATINGAAAMELSGELGSVAVGKKANLFITKQMTSPAYLPYSFGSNLIESVILNGKIIV